MEHQQEQQQRAAVGDVTELAFSMEDDDDEEEEQQVAVEEDEDEDEEDEEDGPDVVTTGSVPQMTRQEQQQGGDEDEEVDDDDDVDDTNVPTSSHAIEVDKMCRKASRFVPNGYALLTSYEKAASMSFRTAQLNRQACPLVTPTGNGNSDEEETAISGHSIALQEFEKGRIPFTIKRVFPNNTYTLFNVFRVDDEQQ
jgi:DNA-directed RNA polymerase subunit K/omega